MASIVSYLELLESRVQTIFQEDADKRGLWEALHKGCIHYPDVQQRLTDSTITHAYTAGAMPK